MRIDRPANTDTCAGERCGHPFGEHYVAYDGVQTGCSHVSNDQRDGGAACRCEGFLIAYAYKPRTRAKKAQP